ncbi:Acetate kinase [Euzebya pacifica]|uniref:Acetate kinase n=1 Tax=Euzebya pacifica TaxID=1608957 RepID=A0A346XS25_9ACTN|nr:acetate kinase [Euzebya pacifica]AXV05022.1 Acetate kinase [Euzebya pacifica]
MRVLVLNAGSSSLKYRLLADDDTPLVDGIVERIGEEGGVADHTDAIDRVVADLTDAGLDDTVEAVGHRVVHGGATLTEPVLIDDDVIATIESLVPLAPLHNPANLLGIRASMARRPNLPQVAVFDTAFHATIPPAAHRYALPEWTFTEHGVRRYGFHGTSHAWVSRAAADHLGKPLADTKLVTLHLGNGASAAAIDGGVCVDTSMGMAPLEGLVMGTRSGDVDPAVIFHLMREDGLSGSAVEDLLTRQSGLKGLSGDNDMRTIEQRAGEGDEAAKLALDVTVHRLVRYVGAFAAVLGGMDALVFTAGIGEHSALIRRRVCERLGFLGVSLDEAANIAAVGPDRSTTISTGPTPVLVVPTDEEAEIAHRVRAVVAG